MKPFQEWTDPEVLEYVGPMGRMLCGDYLFERAEWIRANNPHGHTGPMVTGYYQPSEVALADLASRGMVADAVADEVVPERRKPGRPKKVAD